MKMDLRVVSCSRCNAGIGNHCRAKRRDGTLAPPHKYTCHGERVHAYHLAAHSVPCPTCHAKENQPCKGVSTTSHPKRLDAFGVVCARPEWKGEQDQPMTCGRICRQPIDHEGACYPVNEERLRIAEAVCEALWQEIKGEPIATVEALIKWRKLKDG